MDSLLDKLNGTSSDRAQQQLDALREALEIRLSALEAVLADPSRGESLEGLIVELARVATEEAQAAALKVCLDVKLEADVRVADARVAAQETVDEERSANAELRRAGEQGRQRLANLEQEQLARLRVLREDLEAEIAGERSTAAGLERAVSDAQRQLQAERTVSADLRAAIERAQTLSATLEREKAQAWTAQEALTANLVRERETAAALQRASVETQSLLQAERAVSADLRRVVAHTEQQLSHAVGGHAQLSASQSEVQEELATARAEADAARADLATARADLTAAGTRLEMLDGERLRADGARAALDARLASLNVERDALAAELQAARQIAAPRAPRPVPPSHAAAPSPMTEPSPAPSSQTPNPAGWGPVRLSVRHTFHEPIEVQINGDVGVLVELSTTGCQLVSPAALKPNQVVKVLLPAAEAPVACVGKVMWARFERRAAGRSLAYRAGVQFTKPDQGALEAFVAARANKT